MNRTLQGLLLACATAGSVAQQLPPAGADYFSDKTDAVEILDAGGFPHGLIFQGGGFLHGELVAISQTEIVWRRPDADQPIRIPRSEVRRVVLESPMAPRRTPRSAPMVTQDKAVETVSAPPLPATVKLPGSDWLHGDVRTKDGQKFTLSLKNGFSLEFARESLEWIFFQAKPAPAYRFSGNALALGSWRLGRGAAPATTENGVLTLPSNDFLGRSMSPTSRIEVAWSMPDGKDRVARLWLQPFQIASPDSYGRGTVALTIKSTLLERRIYVDDLKNGDVTPLKEEAGPARYRAFYDLEQNKLAVMRNDKVIGDWKLREDPEAEDKKRVGRIVSAFRPPASFCLDAGFGKSLRLESVVVKPWNGTLPKADGAEPAEDRLSLGKEPALTGKLEAVDDRWIAFAGQARPRSSAGTFIELAQTPAKNGVEFSGDALVSFGNEGELVAADVEIADGRFKFRSSAVPLVEGPVAQLQVLVFAQKKALAASSPAVLVFRNGDHLPGTLVGVSHTQGVHWRTTGGQEVAFATGRIAGMRWPGAGAAPGSAGTLVELRNGDQIHGTSLTTGQERFVLKHPLLGELAFDQAKLWQLLIHPAIVTSNSEAEAGPPEVPAQPAGERNFLDGHILQFGQPAGPTLLAHTFANPPDRFELRVEAKGEDGLEPNATFALSAQSGATVQVSVSYGSVNLYGFNLPTGKGGNQGGDRQIERQASLPNHPPDQVRDTRELRLFIDQKLGTVDVFVDGLPALKAGHPASERMPGIGKSFTFASSVPAGKMVVFSGLWAGPWNGEVPKPGDEGSGVALKNGDFASGKLKTITGEKLILEGEAGDFEIPLDRVTQFRAGGGPVPMQAAARVRLRDGSIVHLDKFRWEKDELQARSPILGALALPAASVAELILSPAPIRFPTVADPKNPKEKAPEFPPGELQKLDR